MYKLVVPYCTQPAVVQSDISQSPPALCKLNRCGPRSGDAQPPPLPPVPHHLNATAGRAGYGWVLFDLASGRLAGRGCMSLRYRQTSGQAEFEGLLAGLAAARDARVACLAVQVGARRVVA